MAKTADTIAIYSRKSRYTGKGESIGNQIDLCREYIRTHYGDAAAQQAVVFEDEGFSGGNLNRPDFKKMMTAAKERKIRAIVVYRLDRISRNISDFSSLIEELGRLGIDFVSIRESFDTSSPMGRAMMYIASVFSQLERETIAERIRDNMHELAKTGRWLGGTTPTGYASESVKRITVDGKTKKACKLKLLPDEAEIIYKIFDLYEQYDSLTTTETELLRQGVKTKTGRSFTRFSIKSILQNPVYLIADKDAYQYFVDNEAELFSPESDFDGVRGVLAYNRSDQEKGRATVYNPINEWIVSVGEHPGIISSNRWIRVQESLERNKSKSYHASRGNEALLTGLLWCSCGSRMYPKVTGRKTAEGRVVFPYMCKLKERSRRELCSVPNANGNLLDAAICEQVKHLADHSSDFMKQLEKARSAHAGNRSECETKLSALRKEQAETQRKITALIDSLADFGDSTAAIHLKKRIEELNGQDAALSSRIRELESLTDEGVLAGMEFDLMRQLLTVFHDNIDDMTVTQKRAAIRTVVRKVVWDGKVAHVVLFGSPEDEIDWTTFPVDPEEDENAPEGGGDGSDSPSGVRSGEDSKRDPHAVPAGSQERADRLLAGSFGDRRGLGADLSRRDTGRLLHGGQLRAAGGCPAAAAAAGHSACPGAADLTAAVRAGRAAAPDPAGDRRAAGHQPQLCFPAGDPRAGTAAAGVGQTQLVFHSYKIFNCNSSSCSKVYRRLKASTSSFLERRGGSPSAFKSLALRSALPGLPESPHSYKSV